MDVEREVSSSMNCNQIWGLVARLTERSLTLVPKSYSIFLMVCKEDREFVYPSATLSTDFKSHIAAAISQHRQKHIVEGFVDMTQAVYLNVCMLNICDSCILNLVYITS
ncbi:hypothetical protein AVEN_241180-1 [Araneus ventricosus]|uniref:Uncharacterized protein n=1 Tax=Araneus ventricosus TaxID=182803 RepID=A0A4Y2G4Y6_ARAVE|nr:hypothetical protein AVEN_241180-1 [Araneus ventricosus]